MQNTPYISIFLALIIIVSIKVFKILFHNAHNCISYFYSAISSFTDCLDKIRVFLIQKRWLLKKEITHSVLERNEIIFFEKRERNINCRNI